jgi:hypothetical protein
MTDFFVQGTPNLLIDTNLFTLLHAFMEANS